MKLEKSDNFLHASLIDSPLSETAYRTNIDVELIRSTRCRLDFRKDVESISKGVIADLDKGKVEQLIYILTLARNRME